jgi:acetyl-CoA synthase
MPKALKEELAEILAKTAEEMGLEDFLTKIADETVAQTEEEVAAYMQKVNHPALTLAPMF